MKKLFVLVTLLMISINANAGLTEVYNAVNTNPDSSATKVDQKAAEIKNKIDSKLSNAQNKLTGKIADKLTDTSSSTSTLQQELLKSQLEAKLANLVKSGQASSSKATEIKAEIESLQKLISAAQQ